MAAIGDKFPTDIKLQYIPYEEQNDSIVACSTPIAFDLAKQLPGKKIVFVAVPGAFTPTCTADHIPPYVAHLDQLKTKGVDKVVVLSANDAFVLAAWGKALGAKNNFIIFASDPLAKLSKELGLELDLSSIGFGLRTARYAAIVEDGVIKYLEKEPGSEVSVSGYEAVSGAL